MSEAEDKPTRRRAKPSATAMGGESRPLQFVSSGAGVLDCVLGGGFPLGRIVNIAGDRSSGKTLLAIEACANFHRLFPSGLIRYAEAEAAFDTGYARQLGMPIDAVQFADDVLTVEDFFEDLERTLANIGDQPAIYVLDSLDALSDRAELERKIDDGSYGAAKAKKLGELFRRLVKKLESSQVLLLIISQIRDKIGVTFGKTTMRSGGRALDFYASQILWLAEVAKIKKTVNGIERVVGIDIKAKTEKNKIGLPFRECQLPILFMYGVDDISAGVDWLLKVLPAAKVCEELGLPPHRYRIELAAIRNEGGPRMLEFRSKVAALLVSTWAEVEKEFMPKSSKYA